MYFVLYLFVEEEHGGSLDDCSLEGAALGMHIIFRTARDDWFYF